MPAVRKTASKKTARVQPAAKAAPTGETGNGETGQDRTTALEAENAALQARLAELEAAEDAKMARYDGRKPAAEQKALRGPILDDGLTNANDVDAGPTDLAIATLLDDRDHMRDCPVAEGTAPPRVEMYEAVRPANPAAARPAQPVTIVRCITCGGSCKPIEKPLAEIKTDLGI